MPFALAIALGAIAVATAQAGTGAETCTAAAGCKAGATGVGGGEFNNPGSVAVDGAGNVYVADQGNDRIQKFDSSGNFLLAWGKDVGGAGVGICTAAASCQAGSAGGLGGQLNAPIGVAADSSGNVYTVEFGDDRVQKFDSSGNFLLAWGKDVGGAGVGMCTVATSCQTATGGGRGGEFLTTGAIATDTAGHVYVAERSNHRIQKFDSSGNFLLAWGKDVGGAGNETCIVATSCQSAGVGGLGGEFSDARGVATDGSGNVYVSDDNSQRIQKFDSSGNFLLAWGKDVGGAGVGMCTVATSCQAGSVGGLGGEFSDPLGLATDGAGDVAVADTGNQRVQGFDTSGNFVAAGGKDVVQGGGSGFEECMAAASCQAGSPGALGGEFDAPKAVVSDASGNGYVADAGNQRIQKADPLGSFVLAWGEDVATDMAASSPPPQATVLSPPQFAQTVTVQPVSGTVLVKVKGAKHFQVLTAGEQIPVGSIVDATKGRVRLTSAKTQSGSATETADFYDGVFAILQPGSGKPITELSLVDSPAARAVDRLARSGHKSNGLWGDGHGNYVTKGKHGSATVRGTIWFTRDQPTGTFFKVKKDTVLVRDFTQHRTKLLHAGQHYLAPAH